MPNKKILSDKTPINDLRQLARVDLWSGTMVEKVLQSKQKVTTFGNFYHENKEDFLTLLNILQWNDKITFNDIIAFMEGCETSLMTSRNIKEMEDKVKKESK